MSNHRVEGLRRIREASYLIQGAIRLGEVTGDEVYVTVRAAVTEGAALLAEDIEEEFRVADRAEIAGIRLGAARA